MYFTREDILKILKALLQIGTKDSEFKNAQLPLLEQDVIAVVQNGANRKVKVNDIIGLFNLLNRQDFINVSDMYDEHYITINEAIKLMPLRKRKEGLVITFQNTSGKWQIYQFKGTIDLFVNPTYWEDLFGLEYPIINSIIPDGEDLTMSKPDEDGNSLLSFKDKDYDPEGFSGMATKILRKNIIEIGGVKKNILTLDMISLPNTVYEIKYDFEIIDTIILGENSKFNFTTGSITYKGNKLNTSNVYSSLIGMIPNSNDTKIATNNSNILAYYLNLNLQVIIDNVYYLAPCNIELNHINLYGISELISKLNLLFTTDTIFKVNTNIDNIIIKNLSIYGNRLIYYGGNFILSRLQSLYSLHNIIVENIEVSLSRILTLIYPDIDMSINKITLYAKNIYAHNIAYLFKLDDLPIEKAVFDSLTIRNFHTTCIAFNSTNEYINNSASFNKLCIVKNCDVENDYVSTDNITYFSLIVFEGLECHYYNNMIKNLVNTNPESVVYDSYLSAKKLYYYNNIVENIASLNPLYRDIYKSKNGGKIKWFKNNTYTLSPQFFEENGILENNWGNSLGNLQGLSDIVIFEGNTIDILFGILSAGNFISAKKIYFSNNTIKAVVGDNTFGSAIMFIRKDTEYIEINNNSINIDNKGKECFYLFRELLDTTIPIIIKNNYFKNVAQAYFYVSTPIYTDYNIIMLNNTLVNNLSSTLKLENSDIINDIGFLFNVIKNINLIIKNNIVLRIASGLRPQTYQCIFVIKDNYTNKIFNTLVTVITDESQNTKSYTVYTNDGIYQKEASILRVNVGSPYILLIFINEYGLNYYFYRNTTILDAHISTEIHDYSYYFPSTAVESNPQSSNILGVESLIYNSTLKKPLWWNGSTWTDALGIASNLNTSGTTSQRPVDTPEGFEYYDSTLKKKILWNGTSWVNMDGTALG